MVKCTILQKPRIKVSDEKLLFRIIKTAYTKRRKQIANSLLDLGVEKEALLEVLKNNGIDPKTRPEELGLEEFGRISDSISKIALD